MSDPDLDELRSELEDFAQPQKKGGRPPREERIIAGFEDIQRFVEKEGRPPQHGEGRDIFERLYAVRLDRLRALDECRMLLEPLDHQGLLKEKLELPPGFADADEQELLEELEGVAGSSDITELRHVRTNADKRAAEEIANREQCADFDKFKPLFDQVQHELAAGVRTARPFVRDAGFLKADITKGQFFILGGQIAYVAEVGETFRAPNGQYDARLRVIYSNGTESNLLRRSLQRALYKDEGGRRITDSAAGPLFGGEQESEDLESGTVYVLRSRSQHPDIATHRELIHKIGVTGGKVDTRIANAALDATYLLAEVEVVATYKLFNINRSKFEHIVHRVFGPAQLQLTIQDRFGHPVKPKEWFLVPLPIIDEAIEKIRDGSIVDFEYDPAGATLKKRVAA